MLFSFFRFRFSASEDTICNVTCRWAIISSTLVGFLHGVGSNLSKLRFVGSMHLFHFQGHWLRFWPFSARVQMVFGTFRIYGYRLCFAVRGFRKRCSMARFRDSFAACFRVLFPSSLIEGSCALSLLFLSVVFVFPLPFFGFRGYHLQCYLQMGYNQLHPCRLFAWRGLESFRSCVS